MEAMPDALKRGALIVARVDGSHRPARPTVAQPTGFFVHAVPGDGS